jgi:hypothetical protein
MKEPKKIGTEGPVWAAEGFDEPSLVARQFSSPDSLYGQIFNCRRRERMVGIREAILPVS